LIENILRAIVAKCYFDQLKVNGVSKSDYSPVKDRSWKLG
jgi:hypothetical protein